MLNDPEALDRLIEKLQAEKAAEATGGPPMPPLIPRSKGGTPPEMSPDWKQSVNEQLKQLNDDFRRLVGWLIAAVAAPLLAIIGLYVYVGSKSDVMENKITAVQVEQAKATGNAQAMDARINGKLDLIAERMSKK